MTKFGSLGRVTSRELATAASMEAMQDAGITPTDVEGVYFGLLSGDIFEHQMHTAPSIPDYLGMNNIPSTRVEAACASGGLAAKHAILSVASGLHDVALATGAEKMTNLPVNHVTEALAMCADDVYELSLGITFPGAFAMAARAYDSKFGDNSLQRASIAVKNHKNAMDNPLAQFHKEISVEKVLNSVMIADPLRLYDCSPITDGGAAIIVVPWDDRKKYEGPAVKVRSFAQASDTMALHDRSDFTGFTTTKVAAKTAFKRANLEPKDIDFVEVHDCFTIAEIMATEDMGFFEKGKGGQAALDGETARDGHLPVNASGGLKAKGHPIGATGVSQIVEVSKQLRGMAGKRQLPDVNIGMTQNLGGSGSTIVSHILERGD